MSNIKVTSISNKSMNIEKKSLGINFLNELMVDIPKSTIKNRILDKNFFIPSFHEYDLLISNNYKVPQLKKICKFYKLKSSGNKQVLINLIYKHLYFSNYIILIQKLVKGFLCRKWCHSHGPAYLKRSLCTNNDDFFTMEDLKGIPINQFFSYKDKDDFVYGFNIISLYTLWTKATEKNQTALNPYNRNPLPSNLIKSLRKLIRLSRILKYDIEIQIKEDFIDPKKQLELRILALFQSIDQLGNYSNPQWFNSLSYSQLIIFLRELYDIWNYRAQLSNEIKLEIVPPTGDPFRGNVNAQYINQIPSHSIKKIAITIMESLVKKGINRDSQILGANYVLCALTLVSYEAASSLPWLYQSVAHSD